MGRWSTLAGICLVMCCGCGDPGSLVKQAPETDKNKVNASTNDADTKHAGSEITATNGKEAAGNVTGTERAVAPVATPQSKADTVQVIAFDDLNLGMQEDARFRPIMLQYNDARAKELLGSVINIAGHMNPPDQLRGLTEFVLLKNKDCKFGPGGQADHLARVYMKKGTTVDYTDAVIYVEGKITLQPFPDDSPMTWSIYDIEATKVSTRPPSRKR